MWDWLRIGFGRDRICRDVASIGVGKWRQKIDKALAASKACVAVFGRRWADEANLPRLLDPADMVRCELETALAYGELEDLEVVPLLVEEARLQAIPIAELPDSLQPPRLIQSLSQARLPGLSAWVEVGGIASSLCPKASLPQPISI